MQARRRLVSLGVALRFTCPVAVQPTKARSVNCAQSGYSGLRWQPDMVRGPARTVDSTTTHEHIVKLRAAVAAMGSLAQPTSRISSLWCRSALGGGILLAPRIPATDAPLERGVADGGGNRSQQQRLTTCSCTGNSR